MSVEHECDWCGRDFTARRRDAETCTVVCRKRRWRFRTAVVNGLPLFPVGNSRPMRFAYADPPYPGLADYYQERAEVDHAALIGELTGGWIEGELDGWALSSSAAALPIVLPMCPSSTRVCVWRRRVRYTPSTRALSAWEPLLVVGGRPLPTDVPQDLLDELYTSDVLDYRGRYGSFTGALIGMKPPEFAVWLFRQLGATAGDELHDLYPGSGAIGRAWSIFTDELSRRTVAGRDAKAPAWEAGA